MATESGPPINTPPAPRIIKRRIRRTAVITHPKQQKIDVAKALKLRLQGNTLEEIGAVFGVTRSAVHDALQRFQAFTQHTDTGVLTAYSEHRAELFNAVELHLTASLLDGDAMAKASLNNRAYAFKQIHEARRLQAGESTSNVSILGKFITDAEAKLGAPPLQVVVDGKKRNDTATVNSQAIDIVEDVQS